MLHIVTIAVRQIIHAAFAIQTQVFFCKFCEHFKNNFFTENIRGTAFEPLNKYFVHFSFCKIILIPLGLYFLSEVLKTDQDHQQYHACSFPNKTNTYSKYKSHFGVLNNEMRLSGVL